MSGFILKEIQTDKILMVRGEEKLTVAMIDPNHPKERREAATTATPPKQPQAAPAATPSQKQREARRSAAVGQAPAAASPRVSPPDATQPQPTTTPVNPSSPGRGIKGAPQNLGSSSSQVDTSTNRAPGAMIRR